MRQQNQKEKLVTTNQLGRGERKKLGGRIRKNGYSKAAAEVENVSVTRKTGPNALLSNRPSKKVC